MSSYDIDIAGTTWSGVPAFEFDKHTGGTARYTCVDDTTATASDVAQGSYFYSAAGVRTAGSASSSNDFIVTISWDDDYFSQDEGAWVPDQTFAEIQAAYSAGKDVSVNADWDATGATVDGYFFTDNFSSYLIYCVQAERDGGIDWYLYVFDSTGVTVDDSARAIFPNFDSPSVVYTPSNSQQTDTVVYDPDDYNGLQQVNVTVNAVPTVEVEDIWIQDVQYVTENNQRKWEFKPFFELENPGFWYTSSGYYISPGFVKYNAVASNTTVTPSTSSQTIGGANYMMEGAVTVNPIPSQYIIPSGNLPITQNGTGIDVASYATVSVDVSGGGSSLHTDTASTTPSSASTSISFTGLSGEPTSFYIVASDNLATGAAPYKTAAVVFDGTNVIGQTITNTSNAQVTYDGSGFSKSYSNGTLTVTGQTQFQAVEYLLFYSYGGGAVDTIDVQVGSGATSIEFDDLADEPAYWSVIFKSNFSTSSGYQRVITVGDFNSEGCLGLAMGSGAVYSETDWTASYSNGTLTLTSQGTNAGGYFHQPGYYQLTYAYDAAGNYQSKTVTPTESIQTVTADNGYDALRRVTVNAIPSQYIVPTGNLAITSNTSSGQSLDVSQYATATVNVPTGGGGSWTVKQTTWTPSNTSTVSHTFSNLSGTPKAAVLRCTAQLTRSSSNTYYYIADIIWDGTDAWGNYHLRSNGTFNNVAKDAASGFSVTTGSNSITFSSDASSRSSAPGSFYNGAYELTYWY